MSDLITNQDDQAILQAVQFHVHEFLGSVILAEEGDDRHNHRFAGISSEAIFIGNGHHVHLVTANTDFFEDHYHPFNAETSIEIAVSDDKHVHFVFGETFIVDDHFHVFQFATLIESPLTPIED